MKPFFPRRNYGKRCTIWKSYTISGVVVQK
nr:MAG TPA: hypothetical protein [Herelleviridae sp.]